MRISRKSFIPDRLRRPGGRWALLGLSLALLLVLGAASICLGAVRVSPTELWEALAGRGRDGTAYQIVAYVRLPRTLAAVFAGSALAVAGAVLQTVLGNALAGPNIIGVNAGAGLFTILLAAFFPSLVLYTPLAAFLGALAASLLVYGIARGTGASRLTIVLSGVAVSSFLGAITDTVLTLFPDTQMNRMAFLIGSLSGVSMERLAPAAGAILFSLAAVLLLGSEMDVLALGDETASSLGLRTEAARMVFLFLAALLAGGAVSFAGLLGFIGLIVPHAARFLIGRDSRFLCALCILLGGAFTLGCDLLARLLFAPYEIPAGIVMSFLGGPFFILLLLRGGKGRGRGGGRGEPA